jgi:hypothetical protein
VGALFKDYSVAHGGGSCPGFVLVRFGEYHPACYVAPDCLDGVAVSICTNSTCISYHLIEFFTHQNINR